MTMEDDDDGPPMLVAADGSNEPSEASLSTDTEDAKIARVPITIITGMFDVLLPLASAMAHLNFDMLFAERPRVPKRLPIISRLLDHD